MWGRGNILLSSGYISGCDLHKDFFRDIVFPSYPLLPRSEHDTIWGVRRCSQGSGIWLRAQVLHQPVVLPFLQISFVQLHPHHGNHSTLVCYDYSSCTCMQRYFSLRLSLLMTMFYFPVQKVWLSRLIYQWVSRQCKSCFTKRLQISIYPRTG